MTQPVVVRSHNPVTPVASGANPVSFANISSVDAKYYGIESSTTADQTSKFQDMADDQAGNNGARTIILPAGEFHITDEINIKQSRPYIPWPATTAYYETGFRLKGQGRTATEIFQETAGKSCLRIYTESTTSFRNEGYLLEGFGLYGQGVGNADNCGIQMGGVSTDRSDVIHDLVMRDVLLKDFASSLRLDDVTGLYMEQVLFEHFLYGIEMGFNIDIIHANLCSFGAGTVPGDVSCTTDGTTTVTTADTSQLEAGMGIQGATLDDETVIVSITDGTDFEITPAATGSGTQNFNFSSGTAISYGAGPWTPAFTTPGQESSHKFTACWFMRNHRVVDVQHASASQIMFDTCYSERCNRFATLNATGAVSGIQNFLLLNHQFSQPSGFAEAAIWEDGSSADAASLVKLQNCYSPDQSAVPWIRCRSNKVKLSWEQNNLRVSTGDMIQIFDANTAFSPPAGVKWSYGMGEGLTFREDVGTTGALTPRLIPNTNHVIKIGPVTGAVTINDAASGGTGNAMIEGAVYTFSIQEDGTAGHAITWNATYIFHTAWTDSTVTADADKHSVVQFYYDGADFHQISAANHWA